MLYGNLAFFIGGGGQMAGAMVWTILADAVPVAERTDVFFRLYALTLVLAVVVNPIAAMLLNIDPWIAMWLGFGILVLGMFSSLLVPETLRLRQAADSKRRARSRSRSIGRRDEPVGGKKSKLQQTWFAVRNDMGHIWRFIFASKSIMMLIAAYGLFFPVKLNVTLNILQYMTKRFNWKWSTVRWSPLAVSDHMLTRVI